MSLLAVDSPSDTWDCSLPTLTDIVLRRLDGSTKGWSSVYAIGIGPHPQVDAFTPMLHDFKAAAFPNCPPFLS